MCLQLVLVGFFTSLSTCRVVDNLCVWFNNIQIVGIIFGVVFISFIGILGFYH